MGIWTDVTYRDDLKQFEVELNRKLRHSFSKITGPQLSLSLNSIDGVLGLTKGGTGSALSAPATDRILFYDKSANKSDWLDTGDSIEITDKTIDTIQDIRISAKPTFSGGYFGDFAGGDYLEIKDDGTIERHGDATLWVDMQGPLITERIESPSSDIVQNLAEGSLTFKSSARNTDFVVHNTQLLHEWLIGSDIYPHLHWWQTSSLMPNWLIQYRWQRNGLAKNTAWTNVPLSTNAFTYSTGTLNQITTFGAITPPVNAELSDIIQWRLIRDYTNVTGLFAGAETSGIDVDAVTFDVHVEKDTDGSRQEYIK